MIHALALLLLVTALVIGIPAFRQLRYMRRINHNAGTTPGHVTSVPSSLGWLWTANFGNVTRPRISYTTPRGTEMVLEIATSSMFTFRRYEAGMPVEVVFDQTSPGEAYARPEWEANLRDFWSAWAALFAALALAILARIYHL
jgi:hypothetical protein